MKNEKRINEIKVPFHSIHASMHPSVHEKNKTKNIYSSKHPLHQFPRPLSTRGATDQSHYAHHSYTGRFPTATPPPGSPTRCPPRPRAVCTFSSPLRIPSAPSVLSESAMRPMSDKKRRKKRKHTAPHEQKPDQSVQNTTHRDGPRNKHERKRHTVVRAPPYGDVACDQYRH